MSNIFEKTFIIDPMIQEILDEVESQWETSSSLEKSMDCKVYLSLKEAEFVPIISYLEDFMETDEYDDREIVSLPIKSTNIRSIKPNYQKFRKPKISLHEMRLDAKF
jgi:hypothetical protein